MWNQMRRVLFLLVVTALTLLHYVQSEIDGEPFQLVVPDDETHTKLVLVEEGLEKLRSIHASEIVVLGVVGSFHSGKSFLMNQLVNDPKRFNGFRVGPEVTPETAGIWAWFTHDPVNGKPLLLLDTEGLCSSEANALYDSKIFAVTALTSSALIYNTQKIIDVKQVEYLELLAHKAKLFTVKNELDKVTQSSEMEKTPKFISFPPLYWVVRDFNQILEMKPTEYLHDILHRFHVDEIGAADNLTHEALLEMFESTSCHTMHIPSIDYSTIQDLNIVGTDSESFKLQPKWTDDVASLRDAIFSYAKPKSVFGTDNVERPMTAPTFAGMFEMLVEAVNKENALMAVPSAWESFVQKTSNEALKSSISFFEETMRSRMDKALPYDLLNQSLETTQEETRDLMKRMVFNVKLYYDPFMDSLEIGMDRLSISFVHENLIKVREFSAFEADNAENTLETVLSGIPLPVSRKSLENKINTASTEVKASYAQSMIQFKTLPNFDFEGELKKVEKHLKWIAAIIREENHKTIVKAVLVARENATMCFSALNDSTSEMSNAEFEQRKDELFSEAFFRYDLETNELSDEPEVKDGKNVLTRNLATLSKVFFEKNEERVLNYCSLVLQSALSKYKSEVDNLLLPVESQVFDRLKAQALELFGSKMAKFSNDPVFDRQLEHLKTEFLRVDESLVKLNEAAERLVKDRLASALDTVFGQLKREMHDFWFRETFRWHARDVFKKTVKDMSINEVVKTAVVDEYVTKADVVLGSNLRSLSVAVCFVVIVALVFVGFCRNRCSLLALIFVSPLLFVKSTLGLIAVVVVFGLFVAALYAFFPNSVLFTILCDLFWKTAYNEECPICCCSIQKDEKVIILRCRHQFHSGCLEPWMDRSSTGPICRTKILTPFL